MTQLNSYKGAVLFLDILGMSALTNQKIDLEDSDYEPWLSIIPENSISQYLGASIILEFRNLLLELKKQNNELRVSQLSDCAFIWSEKIEDILVFCSKFMHKAIQRGILCRGGLAYGEIIETSQPNELGILILGDAVTKAVKLESKAKGCRVLINQKLPLELYTQDEKLASHISPFFSPLVNPLTFEEYDEFMWYLTNNLDYHQNSNLDLIDFNKKVDYTKQRLKLANMLRYSPKFSWNSKNKEGNEQLLASIQFLSQNNLIGILHNFEWKSLIETRDQQKMEHINSLIESYKDFRKVRKKQFPENWL